LYLAALAPHARPIARLRVLRIRDWPRLRGALEVHADPRLMRARRLRHTVQPLLLALTAHHDQVAGPRREADRGPAPSRLQQKPPCRTQAEDRDDTLRPSTGEAISMPAGAVAAVPIEIQPHAVIADVVTR